MMKDIYEEVGEPAALELVAEEAAELAQACLKLSRILRGENPTPVPEVLAAEKVMEEAANEISTTWTGLRLRPCRPHSQNRVNTMRYADTVGMKTNFVRVWDSANTAMRMRMVM